MDVWSSEGERVEKAEQFLWGKEGCELERSGVHEAGA
jgi:hypothetical protein